MITDTYTSLTPAYGRDYKSAALAIADFEKGKDFTHQPSGQYCSIRDFSPGCQVNIRYANQRRVATFVVGEKEATK